MKPITRTARTVVNIHTAEYRHWVNDDGSELADQGYLQLDDSFPPGSGFYIYKMEPGAITTPHEHTCRENSPTGCLIAVFVRSIERDLPA